MTEIHGSKDCGNSPKNKFVQDTAIALETGEATEQDFGDDVVWEAALGETINGRSALLRKLAVRTTPIAITIEHAISHGKVGVASGQVTLGDGHSRRFCHVLEFTNAKANCVVVIKTYA